MVAKRMREVMEKAMEEKRLACVDKNYKYANRIINEKCHKRATKGYSNCEVKLSRWCSPILVIEAIEKMGFEVKRNSKNGKVILVIKW